MLKFVKSAYQRARERERQICRQRGRQSDTSFTRSDINASDSFWQPPGNVFSERPEKKKGRGRKKKKKMGKKTKKKKKKVNDGGVLMRRRWQLRCITPSLNNGMLICITRDVITSTVRRKHNNTSAAPPWDELGWPTLQRQGGALGIHTHTHAKDSSHCSCLPAHLIHVRLEDKTVYGEARLAARVWAARSIRGGLGVRDEPWSDYRITAEIDLPSVYCRTNSKRTFLASGLFIRPASTRIALVNQSASPGNQLLDHMKNHSLHHLSLESLSCNL